VDAQQYCCGFSWICEAVWRISKAPPNRLVAWNEATPQSSAALYVTARGPVPRAGKREALYMDGQFRSQRVAGHTIACSEEFRLHSCRTRGYSQYYCAAATNPVAVVNARGPSECWWWTDCCGLLN
jgi:hypothetical protein